MSIHFRSIAVICCILFFTSTLSVSQENVRRIRVGGLIRAFDEIQVPAKRAGVVNQLNFRKGDSVSAGDVLAKINIEDAQAELDVAKAEVAAAEQAAIDASAIDLARAELVVAKAENDILERVRRSVVELERVRASGDLNVKQSTLETAQSQKKIAELTLQTEKSKLVVAERNVSERTVVAPFDASVYKINNFEGEWAKEGDPIATLIRMDKLQAEGFVSVQDIPPHRVSGAAVTFTLDDGVTAFQGVVKDASPKVESDGKYQIWFEVQNRKAPDLNNVEKWVLRPGMSGQMEIQIPIE